MKKNILFLFTLFSVGFLNAQVEYDALRLSETEITGTAKYMSMAGALGALGRDASALKDNPAGLGVYRSSELTGTLNLSLFGMSPIDWLGKKSNQESYHKFEFNNLAYVMALPTNENDGLIYSNFSFAYNKLRNYNKSFFIGGNSSANSFINYLIAYSNNKPGDINYKNPDMPWLTVLGYDGHLIDPITGTVNFNTSWGGSQLPTYFLEQTGSLSEYSFGWSGNFNNNFFFGANLNLRSLSYGLYSEYKETFTDDNNYKLANVLSQSGFGANIKVGVIYLPVNDLRLGLSLHTPTLMGVTETSSADLYSSKIPVKTETNPAKTPYNNQSFNLWSPFQAQLSAAYLFGKKGLISAEYNFVNYAGARFNSTSNSTENFANVNDSIGRVLGNVHVLKLGAELKVTPNIALRAGYALTTPSTNKNYKSGKLLVPNSVNTNTEYSNQIYNSNYYSVGVGYLANDWSLDLSYALKMQKEDFYQSLAFPAATIDTKTNNIVLTLGLKF